MRINGRCTLISVAVFGFGFAVGVSMRWTSNAGVAETAGAMAPAGSSVPVVEQRDTTPTATAVDSAPNSMVVQSKESESEILRKWVEAHIREQEALLRDPDSRRGRTMREANRIRGEIEIFGRYYEVDPVALRTIADLSAETMIERLAVSGDLRREADALGRDDIDWDRYRTATDQLDAKLAQDLKQVLGEDLHARFVDFGQRRREWIMVDRFADFAAGHGHSLSLHQQEQIVAVLKEAHGKISERSASEPIKQLLDAGSADLLDRFVVQAELIKRVEVEDEELKRRLPSPK